MRMLRTFQVWLLLAVPACGPVDGPPPPIAPMNDGCPNGCTDYKNIDSNASTAVCTVYGSNGDSFCSVPGSLSFVLVIQTPQTSASPQTFAVSSDELLSNRGTVNVPPTTDTQGVYLALPSTAADLGWDLFNAAAGVKTTLPVRTTFLPQYDPTRSGALDAQQAGLPLPPVIARSVVDIGLPQGEAA